jgi:hypothetical protein
MHVVVNHLPMKEGTDWPVLARKFDEFHESVRKQSPAFRGAMLLRAEQNEAIVLVLFDSRAALDEVSRSLAVPWFAEHFRPHLAGPASRSVGEMIAGAPPAQK